MKHFPTMRMQERPYGPAIIVFAGSVLVSGALFLGSANAQQTSTSGNSQQPATAATSNNAETRATSANQGQAQTAGAASETTSGTAGEITPTAPDAQGLMPKTTIFSTGLNSDKKPNGEARPDVNDLIGPLPKGKVAFIGGIVTKVDHVRNRVNVKVFKGNTVKAFFDDRSHVYKNGVETTQMAVEKGDRVYLDTQLDKNSGKIFARNLRIVTGLPPAEADGQILAVDNSRNLITLEDRLSAQPVSLRLSPTTVVRNSGQTGTRADLTPGSIVNLSFISGAGAARGMVKDVDIVAKPGQTFTLYGEVSHLDMRTGKLGVRNKADDKFYAVNFDPAKYSGDDLKMGAGVVVDAVFNGKDYDAKSVTIDRTASENDSAAKNGDEDQASGADTNDKKAKKDKKHSSKKADNGADDNPEEPN